MTGAMLLVIGSPVILSRRDVLRVTVLSAFTPLLEAGQQPAQVKASQALPWKHGVCLLGGVPDYWANEVPVNVAANNFPELQFDYFNYWGSHAASQRGSRNLIGIRDPAVDALIERIVFADTRDELVAATPALDRVLLWNHFVVPQWMPSNDRTARWDRFDHPEHMPKYGQAAFPALWWWKEEHPSVQRQARTER